MFVRTSFEPYQARAEIYLKEVIDVVRDYQFYTENGQRGGPIIMSQVNSFAFANFQFSKYFLPFLRLRMNMEISATTNIIQETKSILNF